MIDEEQLARRLREEVNAVPAPPSVTSLTPQGPKRPKGRTAILAGVAACALAAATLAVGANLWPADQGAETAAPVSPPWATEDGEMLIRCGGYGPPFAPSLVDEGGLDLSADERAEVDTALRQLEQDAGIDAPTVLQETSRSLPWIAVTRADDDGGRMTVLLPSTADGTPTLATADVVELDRSGGVLRVVGWGGRCGAEPALEDGLSWVEVGRDGTTDPSDTTIRVTLMEMQCSGSRDPDQYLSRPYLVETDEAVTVYWTSERVVGGALCRGNPSVERTITLADPLGDRELRDGSTYPARPVK